MLGIPTVLDRLIQQAVLQVIGPIFDSGFSESSYGFRPGRSAQQAVKGPESTWRMATGGWLILIWRSSLIELITTF